MRSRLPEGNFPEEHRVYEQGIPQRGLEEIVISICAVVFALRSSDNEQLLYLAAI
jgi:hypothetical protein